MSKGFRWSIPYIIIGCIAFLVTLFSLDQTITIVSCVIFLLMIIIPTIIHLSTSKTVSVDASDYIEHEDDEEIDYHTIERTIHRSDEALIVSCPNGHEIGELYRYPHEDTPIMIKDIKNIKQDQVLRDSYNNYHCNICEKLWYSRGRVHTKDCGWMGTRIYTK